MSIKYLVTGASGQLGAKAIDALLARVPASDIGALVRRPETAAPLEAKGVTVRIASYDDEAALEAAFVGVERLLLVSSSEVGKRAAQHGNVIKAAKAAGVGFVAYTSILRADTSPLTVLPPEHKATEDALAASGLSYAVLRNGWYTENYAMGAKGSVENGGMIGTIGEGRVSSASRDDYAEAAVIVLTGDLPASGTVYELAGDDSYTLPEFAAALTELSGKEATVTDTFTWTVTNPAPTAEDNANAVTEDSGTAATGLRSGSCRHKPGRIGHPKTAP